MNKKIASIIGIVLGVAIIIVGICVMNPETSQIGERNSLGLPIQFGADFYTEMYDVTLDVGNAVQRAYTNVCNAIGWLIVVIGLFDIAYFIGKMASCGEKILVNHNSTAPTLSASTPQNETAAPVQKAMHSWKCNNCGQLISTSPCVYCGHNENATKASYRCGKCGQNGPYNGNCPTCGSGIKFYNH